MNLFRAWPGEFQEVLLTLIAEAVEAPHRLPARSRG